jgi:hypothetical protein
MTVTTPKRGRLRFIARQVIVGSLISAVIVSTAPAADPPKPVFSPSNLLLSRSVYDNKASNIAVGTILPPNCANTSVGCPTRSAATYNGTYPFVWNNVLPDPSFGITSKIFLDQITPVGWLVNTLEVPNSSDTGSTSTSDQMVTSFSSKSEAALNLSTDGKYVTFMGYVAPIDTIDVSNSNTPLTTPANLSMIDPTNPVGLEFFRAVAQVDQNGSFHFTETNAYSGNNGRAAILNATNNVYYTAGNAGNGSNPQPNGIIVGAGAQILTPSSSPESAQTPGTPTPVASFSVTELGKKADKVGKDDNFRGLTIFNNVIYLTKGSGSNGVNTVYFVDTTGSACPNGVGVPSSFATLPATGLSYVVANLQKNGLPNNMCILSGFPSTPNSSATTVAAPFGLWFADANTLYVADEGDGYTGGPDLYTHAAAQKTAGLQKWIFNSVTKTWSMAYTLQTGLSLGFAQTVPAVPGFSYPSGKNPATGLPWAPATDGLRNITGLLNHDSDGDDTVTVWGITSTVSGNGDTGADPNRLVVIRDVLKNVDPTVASHESFETLRSAYTQEVFRGISFAPGPGVAQ